MFFFHSKSENVSLAFDHMSSLNITIWVETETKLFPTNRNYKLSNRQ